MARTAGNRNQVTLEEIGRALGMSKTTVSRALSGKGRVSEQTRARVLAYARQVGYEAVCPERRPATNNLLLVIPPSFVEDDLPFLRKCMGGISRMAAQRGYDLLLCYADENDTAHLARQLRVPKADGVILSRTLRRDPCLELVRRSRIPYVAVGRLADPDALQVDNDQVGAACEMTSLLLRLGLRRVAFLLGSTDYTVNADRLQGYYQAHEQMGVAAEEGLSWPEMETAEQRTDAISAILERKPDCLLCGDDNLTFAAMKELRQRGIHVPEELRLASLYDSEVLQMTAPAVSAVSFDAAALGTAACRLLLDSMVEKVAQRRIVQGYQVILRESTK